MVYLEYLICIRNDLALDVRPRIFEHYMKNIIDFLIGARLISYYYYTNSSGGQRYESIKIQSSRAEFSFKN